MKYLATGPWMKIYDNAARRVVIYVAKPGEFVTHTQYFELGKVSYNNGHYTNSYDAAFTEWRLRVQDMVLATPLAPVELAEAAELVALADRLVA